MLRFSFDGWMAVASGTAGGLGRSHALALAAPINFRFIANDLWTTKEAVANISAAH